MTTPTDTPRSDVARVALTQALRGMAVAAALVALWVLWGFIGGAPKDERPPSLPIGDLAPERFKWSDAPVPPPGVRPEDGARYKLLVLRDAAGTARAFYLPAADGLATVPAGSSPLSPGVPCDDFAPDFRTRDIGCRQARPGFEFATRLRWALDGSPVTPGATALVAAPGAEQAGEWVWPRPGPPVANRSQ
ncbi:hypothetical protein FVQ98_08520 [Ottowia sp. GY511]|uniref:Rieske domain-containing protein n=1 Tax=Ottowia flava TaxID=2675430 RepID=A0ABW4KMJ2_9BURK|nr:hypothetical protein [Ottowia sp. GY511]TXK29555.1 hypothetical protein FVQ98_08520 [Ottowia sp. GY511]